MMAVPSDVLEGRAAVASVVFLLIAVGHQCHPRPRRSVALRV